MNQPADIHFHDRDFRELMQQHGIETISGVELLRSVRIVNNLYDAIFSERLRDSQLSGPRWGLLMRLYAEEMRGNQEGLSPSVLSYHQAVSKNTVSSLLRGLEDQGLIERRLDCLLYTSDAADDLLCVDLGGRRIIKKKQHTTQS